MGNVEPLYKYIGTCLGCGTQWTLTPEQIEVARQAEIAYSPCCEQPATLIKVKAKGGGHEQHVVSKMLRDV